MNTWSICSHQATPLMIFKAESTQANDSEDCPTSESPAPQSLKHGRKSSPQRGFRVKKPWSITSHPPIRTRGQGSPEQGATSSLKQWIKHPSSVKSKPLASKFKAGHTQHGGWFFSPPSHAETLPLGPSKASHGAARFPPCPPWPTQTWTMTPRNGDDHAHDQAPPDRCQPCSSGAQSGKSLLLL